MKKCFPRKTSSKKIDNRSGGGRQKSLEITYNLFVVLIYKREVRFGENQWAKAREKDRDTIDLVNM